MEQGAFLSSPASKGRFKDGEDTDRNSVISLQLFFLFGDDPVDTCARSFLHPLSSAPPASSTGWASPCWQPKQRWDKQGPKALLTAQLQGGEASTIITARVRIPLALSCLIVPAHWKWANCLSHHKVISREPATPCDNYVSPVYFY